MLVLALVLSACGGGLIDPPSPQSSTVKGQVIAPPEGGIEPVSVTPLAVWGQTPLAGATVTVHQLPGLQLLSGVVATTGDDGSYTLTDVPTGVSLMVVVTKEIGDGQIVRLSTFVENAKGVVTADVDLSTTLAAEVLAGIFSENPGYQASAISFETARQSAQTIAEQYAWNHLPDGWKLQDLTVGGWLIGQLGAGLNSLDEEWDEIAFPETRDSDAEAAKAAIHAIRNAGYAVGETLETKLVEIGSDLTEEMGAQFVLVAHGINLVAYIANYVFEYAEPGEYVWDFGEANYLRTDDAESEDMWVFYDIFNGDIVVTTITATGEDSYELTVESESKGFEYTFEYTLSCGCPEVASASEGGEPPLAQSLLAGSGTLKDAALTGEVYFELEHEFLMWESKGADTLHVYVMSDLFELEGTLDIHSVGYISVVDLLNAGGDPSGDADGSLSFEGWAKFPSFEIGGELLVLFIEMEDVDVDETWNMPYYFMVSGYLKDREVDPTELNGRFAIELAMDERFPIKSVSFDGGMKAPNQAPVELSVAIRPEDGVIESDIAFKRLPFELVGTATVSVEEDGGGIHFTQAVLDLSAPGGLKVEMTFWPDMDPGDFVGTITKGEDEVARLFIDEYGFIRVVYRDGQYETLL